MIALTKLRELDLAAPPSAGRPLHLSAASGLVCLHSFIYVVADDELHLGVFSEGTNAPGHLVRLFEGDLPDSKKARKKQKPDLEAITLLPPHGDHPHGALLALGSGSRRNRFTGVVIGLEADGALRGQPRAVDLSPLMGSLDETFPALNIEGAVVSGGELRLFQRGNKRHPENAMIRFSLAAVIEMLNAGTGAIAPLAIDRFGLGEIDGIPLTVTDASALPNGRMVFTAVAEDTEDSYADGECVGAAVGIIEGTAVRSVHRLDRAHKVEGVHARLDGDVVKLLLVTDADDADIPAGLFSAEMNAA